ncbi:MAG: hypothetical protein J5928_05320 [Firmicutes bacterium]|nr:hypothetical protein [Bacillota bacterium]
MSILPEAMAPNLGFCVLVVCAATMDEKSIIIPVTIIVVASMFIDLFSNQFVGAVAISMLAVAIAVSLVRKHLDLENPLILICFAVGANILYELVYWTIYRIMGTPYSFLYMLKNIPAGILVDAMVAFAGLFFAGKRLGRLRRENYFKEMKW